MNAWVARALIGEIALPKLLARFDNLRLCADEEVDFGGWVFRGLSNIWVEWDNTTDN